MKKLFLLVLGLFLPSATLCFAIDFKINSLSRRFVYSCRQYGREFRQKIVYQFEGTLRVKLWDLDVLARMPSGFDIDPHPKVQASKNGAELADVTSEVIEGTDGYTVKVYNPGQEGDTVEVDLVWNLKFAFPL